MTHHKWFSKHQQLVTGAFRVQDANPYTFRDHPTYRRICMLGRANAKARLPQTDMPVIVLR